MKKMMILFLLICLSAKSQTKGTLYLDNYVLFSTDLYQYIKSNIIEKLSDKDICIISASETKKGTYVCVSTSEKEDLSKDEIIDGLNGYLSISNHYFFLDDPQRLPGFFHVKYPVLKYEYIRIENPPYYLDGGKEWWFLYANNKYYFVNEIISW